MEYVNTGSSLLNLECSGDVRGGYKLGKMLNFVGDSSAGKSYFQLTMLALASYNKHFDSYAKYYDEPEEADEFNKVKLFGAKAAQSIVSPYGNRGSNKLEEFYYTMDGLLDKEKPFLYVLDSLDALSTMAEEELFDENKTNFLKGKEAKGSYGGGQAKLTSSSLRQIVDRLKMTKSLLVVVSQTRDNIGIGFAKKIRSGGNALKFYSSYEIWSSVAQRLKKSIRGIDRNIGQIVRLKITKNKVTGRQYTEIDVPILYGYGIDDIGSMVDWLVKENVWKKDSTSINAPELSDKKFKRSELIKFIEENDKVEMIKDIVQVAWDEVDALCRADRSKQFDMEQKRKRK